MITTIFLPVLFALSFCICQQQDDHPAVELLTQKTWTLASYGYDYNNNNTIDIAEERIADCDTDDTYEFSADGTGFYSDNMLSCCTGISELSFKWKFINAGIEINFPSGISRVHTLSNEQLVTTATGKFNKGQPVTLIRVFRH